MRKTMTLKHLFRNIWKCSKFNTIDGKSMDRVIGIIVELDSCISIVIDINSVLVWIYFKWYNIRDTKIVHVSSWRENHDFDPAKIIYTRLRIKSYWVHGDSTQLPNPSLFCVQKLDPAHAGVSCSLTGRAELIGCYCFLLRAIVSEMLGTAEGADPDGWQER